MPATANPQTQAAILQAGGVWNSQFPFDKAKCQRLGSNISFVGDAMTAVANRFGVDQKWYDTNAALHEYEHSQQSYPIREYLAKKGIEGGRRNTDPAGSKGNDAWNIITQALAAEAAKREFDAAFKELCEVIEHCGIKRGDVVAGKKIGMLAKLKLICAKLEHACKAFADPEDNTKGAYNEANMLNTAYNTSHPECRNVTINTDDGEGGDPKAHTISLDKIMDELETHKTDKESKTKPAEGETKSDVEKKKDAAKAAVGC